MPARDIVLDDCEPIGNLPRESHMDGELQYLHTNMRITVSVNEFTAHAVVNVVNPVLAVSGVILPGMAWVRTDIQVGRPYVRGQEHRYHLVEVSAPCAPVLHFTHNHTLATGAHLLRRE